MKLIDFLNSYEGCFYLTDTKYDVLGYVDDFGSISEDCARLIRSLDRLVGGVSKVRYSKALGDVFVSINLGEVLDSNTAILQEYFPGCECWGGDSCDVVRLLMQVLETEDDEVAVHLTDCFDEIVDLGLHLG